MVAGRYQKLKSDLLTIWCFFDVATSQNKTLVYSFIIWDRYFYVFLFCSFFWKINKIVFHSKPLCNWTLNQLLLVMILLILLLILFFLRQPTRMRQQKCEENVQTCNNITDFISHWIHIFTFFFKKLYI